MSADTFHLHALGVAESLQQPPGDQWFDAMQRLAALALSGPWYQLEYAKDDVALCVPYSNGPSRQSVWVRSHDGEVRIKVAPRRSDPGRWSMPAPHLRRLFAAVVALHLPGRVCATRVAGPAGPAGVRIRVRLEDAATGHHEALFEARRDRPAETSAEAHRAPRPTRQSDLRRGARRLDPPRGAQR